MTRDKKTYRLNHRLMRSRREEMNATQQDCALMIHMSPQRWANLESGRLKNIELKTLGDIEWALDMEVGTLISAT